MSQLENVSQQQRLYLHHHQLDPAIIIGLNKGIEDTGNPIKPIVVGEVKVYLNENGEICDESGNKLNFYPDYKSPFEREKKNLSKDYEFVLEKSDNLVFSYKENKLIEKIEGSKIAGFKFSEEQKKSLMRHLLDLNFIIPLNCIPEAKVKQRLDPFDPDPYSKYFDEISPMPTREVNTSSSNVMVYVNEEEVFKMVQKFEPNADKAKIAENLKKAIVVGISEDMQRPIFLKKDGWFNDGIYDYWPSYKLRKLDNVSTLQQQNFVAIPPDCKVYEFVRFNLFSSDCRTYMNYNAAFFPVDYLETFKNNLSVFNWAKKFGENAKGGGRHVGGASGKTTSEQEKTIKSLEGKRINNEFNEDRSINFGQSTFYVKIDPNQDATTVPIDLKQNGLFSERERKHEYIYKNDKFMRITQEDFKAISVWQILSISHHQLDWSVLYLLNRTDNGKLTLWDMKRIQTTFGKGVENAHKLYNCILVGFVDAERKQPIFLKPDGWFSDGEFDYWPTYVLNSSSDAGSYPQYYEFGKYNVALDKAAGIFMQGKTAQYRLKGDVNVDSLELSESQQSSLKTHFMDYQTILDLNRLGKFNKDRLGNEKWKVNELDDSQKDELVGSVLVGIFIGNSNDKPKWVFMKQDGWFNDGKEDYWPDYELYATKNGGIYYTFEKFNVTLNLAVPSLYFLYNTNFNYPVAGTATALFSIWGASLDLGQFLSYTSNFGVEAFLAGTTAFKIEEIRGILKEGDVKESLNGSNQGILKEGDVKGSLNGSEQGKQAGSGRNLRGRRTKSKGTKVVRGQHTNQKNRTKKEEKKITSRAILKEIDNTKLSSKLKSIVKVLGNKKSSKLRN